MHSEVEPRGRQSSVPDVEEPLGCHIWALQWTQTAHTDGASAPNPAQTDWARHRNRLQKSWKPLRLGSLLCQSQHALLQNYCTGFLNYSSLGHQHYCTFYIIRGSSCRSGLRCWLKGRTEADTQLTKCPILHNRYRAKSRLWVFLNFWWQIGYKRREGSSMVHQKSQGTDSQAQDAGCCISKLICVWTADAKWFYRQVISISAKKGKECISH